MKFIHISDLHIGKRVNEFSMLDDQKHILKEILLIIDQEKPDGILIAGDVYDKSKPSAEAISLFDNFLARLANKKIKTFIISGNHDSPELIAFASKILDNSGIYMSPVYNNSIKPIKLTDEFGNLNIYMLPFIKPAVVRRFFEEIEIQSYTDAVEVAIKNMNVDNSSRNIIITHQFVAGAERSESEDISVGGTNSISADIFNLFDYVALGHIHKPQKCTRDTIRYCGSPLKYSFSEANHNKSVTVVELKEKNNIKISTIPLKPVRDMIEIKGKYNDLMSKEYYDKLYLDDYFHITLTDEEDIPYAMNNLRIKYKNIMKLDYDNTRTSSNPSIFGANAEEHKSPIELVSEFYELQNNKPISPEQKNLVNNLIEKIWGGEL